MEQVKWTKDELVAYILLFAAHSNFTESNHEKNVIISKVDMQSFQKIHHEFEGDNDYQSIQKIIKGLDTYNYSKDDLSLLFADIKLLFFADGEFDLLEQNMYRGLERLLNSGK
ncbi:hypothetical protein ACFO5O_07775 [Geojedonia litorea]|uniref:Tellurite resistance protein TerB n=1 Tax=Geojedonia litorea TaxID=1268269 RepID=A0ABV9N361_9FLAO